ncbi:hypothetical protein C0991_008985 [Blastosporella zonata]|nr:hypothetical protein C0991_008985 [Blastosporella zonata]
MFRAATTEMSCTKEPMLSMTHLVFQGLQDHICQIIAALPQNVNPAIKAGLLAAHQKLSKYYYCFDQSPFYMWAILLDPCIMYEGLKEEYVNDLMLLMDLEEGKKNLVNYYQTNYEGTSNTPTSTPAASLKAVDPTLQKFSFTSRYQKKGPQIVNELEDYFKLTPESFDECRPLQWWYGRRAQYPNLYRLARDILAIPGECYIWIVFFSSHPHPYVGSAVAVERIFSGGRDTISLCRASLHSKTIQTSMLVKHHLWITRRNIDKLL